MRSEYKNKSKKINFPTLLKGVWTKPWHMLLDFNKKSPETAELGKKKLLSSKNVEVFPHLERKCFLTPSVNSEFCEEY